MEPVTPADAVPRRRGPLHRLYDWVLHWSGHRHAQSALFLMALAEASVFPIPPDVLLLSMGMARPRRVARYALIATAGSVVGGLLGYAIGAGLWQVSGDFFFAHLGGIGFTPENFERVRQLYADNAFLAIFAAGFSPIPYKVFTIAAGVFDISIPVFAAASILGRAGRFLLVAAIVAWLGIKAKRFIERHLTWLTLLFVILLALGFLALKGL